MKIPIQITITPTGKPDVYESLKRAEEFMSRLLASETAHNLARQCKIETPKYTPTQEGRKIYAALGFCRADEETHTFSCWEQAAGGLARKVQTFDALAGQNGAAKFNGDKARAWKQSGDEWVEEDAGIHLLSRNGQLVKVLWIEAERR